LGYTKHARMIVYYLTNSPLNSEVQAVKMLEDQDGIIIVNEFVSEGQTPDQGLKNLASDHYFFTDLSENYTNNLAVLCEANCFCSPKAKAFNDDDKSPRTSANRGCFTPTNEEVTQKAARAACAKHAYEHAAALVSIHDQQKEFF
ncbi:hypothetical protein PENTCL1PPCAC_1575, partial [Pristionchus entomophagus]